jgi:hypothetical protein
MATETEYAVVIYLQFVTREGAPTGYAFQQFYPGQARTYGGVSYFYKDFQYSGPMRESGFANAEAFLVFNAETLTLNIWKQACDDLWVARIRTVWLDSETLEETSVTTLQTYSVQTYQNDGQVVTLTVGSPLDAIGADFPARVLTTALVGNLPPSADMRF